MQPAAIKTATSRAPVHSSEKEKGDPDQPGRHAAQTKKTYLAVAHAKNLFKHAAPTGWREKWKHAFDDQHARQSEPKRAAVQRAVYFLADAAPVPELRMALKKSDDGSSTITSLFLLKLAL